MDKQAKSKVIISAFALVFIGLAVYFARAQLIEGSFGQASITNPDIFYSPYENYVNFSINVSTSNGPPGDSITDVMANFSAINSSACGGSGYANMTYNVVTNLWEGNCSVSSFFNLSITNPVPVTISFVATNASDYNFTSALTNLTIVLHNLGLPQGPPNSTQGGCTQFGPATTNFSTVPDFAHVNFVINIQANFSCLAQQAGASNFGTFDPSFRDVMILNLTSVNLSSPQQAQQLKALQNAMNVTLIAPNHFGNARIFIDSAAFAALDTNTTIQFLYLPFTRMPTIQADNPAKLNITAGVTTVALNGYDPGLKTATVNITFKVFGFSGYNMSDSANPLITLVSPTGNITNGSTIVSVMVNGTGTAPSVIQISLNSSLSYIYNSTVNGPPTNTAGCVNLSSDGEIANCTISVNLASGSYVLNVSAWDYGLGVAPGNYNNSASIFILDSVAPQYTGATVSSPSGGFAFPSNGNQDFYFNQTWTDGTGIGIQSVWVVVTNGTFEMNGTMALSAGVYTGAATPLGTLAIIDAGTYNYTIHANDSFGNQNITSVAQYVITKGTPVLSIVNHSSLTVAYGVNTLINGSGCPNNTGTPSPSQFPACTLYRNNVAVATGPSGDSATLAPGNYTYTYNTSGNQNFVTASATSVNLTVTQVTSTLTLKINGVTITGASANLTITYPQQINVSASNSSGALNLERDGASIIGTNGQNLSLPAGSYIFKANITGNTNYSSVGNLYYNVTIAQATPALTVKINGAAAANITVVYPQQINVSASTIGGTLNLTRANVDVLNGQNLSLPAGSYIFRANVTGNTNYTNAADAYYNVSVAQATGSILGYINGSHSGFATTNITNLLLNATLAAGTGSITVYFNGSPIYGGASPYPGNLTNVSTPGNYNLTAVYLGNTNYTASSDVILVTLLSSGATQVNQTNVAVNNSQAQTPVPVTNTSVLANVSVPVTVNSNQTVFLDFSYVLSAGNVSLGNNAVTLARTDNSTSVNYTVTIPANTNISGGAGWDGKIEMPTVNSSAFTAPSSGTTSLVIDLGSTVELNFTSPVKILLGGMTGKNAAWSRGSATLTDITQACNSGNATNVTAPSVINASGTRECYINDGNDLAIWTYHFTTFAAYLVAAGTTPQTTTSSGGGGTITTATDQELVSGYTKTLTIGEVVKFKLNNESHQVILQNTNQYANTATVLIQSSYRASTTIAVGETQNFDVNGDGTNDLSITVTNVTRTTATLVLNKLGSASATPATQPTNATTTPSTSPIKEAGQKIVSAVKGTGWMVWAGIGIVVIVIIVLLYIFGRKKETHSHHR